VFKITAETSSAANVRRIEALTGPEGVALLRGHDGELARAAAALRVNPEHVGETAEGLRARVRELERAARTGGASGQIDVDSLTGSASEIAGARVLTAAIEGVDANALLELGDRLKAKLGDAAIVLGSSGDDRVDLIAIVTPALVKRGVKAGEIVKLAAAQVGGGGGGRDTLARAGGRDPGKLPDALRAAREAIEAALA